jgi:hypothetical protein
MKVTYDANEFTVTNVYDLSDVRGLGRLYTVTPEHFDVTQQRFGLMSPVQCETDGYPDADGLLTSINGNEYVSSPSIDFFDFTTETWSCRTMQTTDPGTAAWDMPRTDPYVVLP